MTEVAHETMQQPSYGDDETSGVVKLDRVSDAASLAVHSQYDGNGPSEIRNYSPKKFVAPRPNMSNRNVVDYFLPGPADEQPKRIIDLAQSISSNLEKIDGQISCDDDNTVRGIVLLLKAKGVIDEYDSTTPHQALSEVSRAMDPFIKKTEEYVKHRVKSSLYLDSMNDIDDLIAYGQIGLLHALPRFDLNVDDVLVLSFCANRVSGSASDAQRDFGAAIRYSRNDHRSARWLDGLDDRHIESLGEEDQHRVEEARKALEKLLSRTVVSLSTPLKDAKGNNLNLEDIIPDLSQDTVEQLDIKERSEAVESLVNRIPSVRNREIIKMRLGLPPYDDEHTFEEIAHKFGFTESRACQIVNRELGRIYTRLNGSGLTEPTNSVTEVHRSAGHTAISDGLNEFQQTSHILSPAEYRVFELISLGMSSAKMARERCFNVEAIKTQRKEIIRKLGAINMRHAIRKAFELGLFQLPEDLDKNIAKRSLTSKKLQILEYVSYGYKNTEIAQLLHVSVDDIKTHIKIIYATTGARNRCHAIKIGFEMGHLEPNRKLYIE